MENKKYFKKFEGTPNLIRIVTSLDVSSTFSNTDIIEQKLTVLNNGAVSFVSLAKNKDIIESLNFDIDTYTAKDIISKVARYFSEEVDTKRYPIIGNYDLTITNDSGISYFYDGSLNNNYTIDGENISEYIRKALNLPQLFVFENHGLKKYIDLLEINIPYYDERILLDRKQSSLIYEHSNSTITINNESIDYILDKYINSLNDNLKYYSTIGENWEYEVKVDFTYGEQLCFGGKIDKAPRVLRQILKDISSTINTNSFGKMLLDSKNSPIEEGIALVSGKGIGYNTWFRFKDISLKSNDIVLITEGYNNYKIGKVEIVKRRNTNNLDDCLSNNIVVQKL